MQRWVISFANSRSVLMSSCLSKPTLLVRDISALHENHSRVSKGLMVSRASLARLELARMRAFPASRTLAVVRIEVRVQPCRALLVISDDLSQYTFQRPTVVRLQNTHANSLTETWPARSLRVCSLSQLCCDCRPPRWIPWNRRGRSLNGFNGR